VWKEKTDQIATRTETGVAEEEIAEAASAKGRIVRALLRLAVEIEMIKILRKKVERVLA
jgi:transcription initiation factor IIE alpha subunit